MLRRPTCAGASSRFLMTDRTALWPRVDLCLPACLRACLHQCLRACVPACLRACVRACVSACLPTSMHACLLRVNRSIDRWSGRGAAPADRSTCTRRRPRPGSTHMRTGGHNHASDRGLDSLVDHPAWPAPVRASERASARMRRMWAASPRRCRDRQASVRSIAYAPRPSESGDCAELSGLVWARHHAGTAQRDRPWRLASGPYMAPSRRSCQRPATTHARTHACVHRACEHNTRRTCAACAALAQIHASLAAAGSRHACAALRMVMPAGVSNFVGTHTDRQIVRHLLLTWIRLGSVVHACSMCSVHETESAHVRTYSRSAHPLSHRPRVNRARDHAQCRAMHDRDRSIDTW